MFVVETLGYKRHLFLHHVLIGVIRDAERLHLFVKKKWHLVEWSEVWYCLMESWKL
jgi:hypothetical protein